MKAFTESFSTTLDSKGRVTLPASVRRKLGLEKGDKVKISAKNPRIRSREASCIEEALSFLQEFDSVETFSFNGERVEVVLSG
ncbi:AbrB/MazE/SpoVT family DNA-binding domain-containing protein [Candidatus Nanosalina sp. VS9-1]|uniref:AbrB/MazE/SpoVT family DNA-binding domain-containing protein n=1 Tax=Candidatus Nanosalina sp. VS9-1 TaxID=3388566 RepID=UPI0039E1488A